MTPKQIRAEKQQTLKDIEEALQKGAINKKQARFMRQEAYQHERYLLRNNCIVDD